MFALRHTAFRVLSKPSTFLLSKSRSITTISRSSILRSPRILTNSALQRRFVSEEAEQRQSTNIEKNKIVDSPESSPTEQESVSSVTEDAAEVASNVTQNRAFVNDAVRGFGTPDADQDSAPGSLRRHLTTEGSPVEPSSNVYIGNLLYEITEDDLFHEMEKFGTLKSTKIVRDPSGRSRGFGYAHYEDLESAAAAVETLHGRVFGGRRLTAQFANGPRPSYRATERPVNTPSKTLFIGNLSFECTDKDLNDLFSSLSNCLDVRVAIDRRTGTPRGFAHADFTDTESATAAIKVLSGKTLAGRQLRADYTSNKIQRDTQKPEQIEA